ncbi:MAG: 2Fe-2S iron-sulfur cluster binding domain-containing protein [Actinobacteria bacterium]|nr:2Fe-2S iron-sulfur cluster binding domain-containing protein [Actinomycetota bacterium]
MSDRVHCTVNGEQVVFDAEPGASLLTVLREQLGITSVKDGCAPQGQCGCCTVLVDGEPRVSCVTAVGRVAGRVVTTIEGLDPATRDALAEAFVATGGSQCGFCTTGIVVRAAALAARGRHARADVDRALAAHLCRCTGWQPIREAIDLTLDPPSSSRNDSGPISARIVPRTGAERRAELEGGVPQRVGIDAALGKGGFADDAAPRDALVAVPCPPGSTADTVDAAGLRWVLGASLTEARERAGKVQGRRTTVADVAPILLPDRPAGGVRLATGWVEPAYLEPDASWCAPGGRPASPLANGGAFGGKLDSAAPRAARELADALGRSVRVVYSREDVVRLGPKRPPMAASAVLHGNAVEVRGRAAGPMPVPALAYALALDARWQHIALSGSLTSAALRAVGLAEHALLVEGALQAAGADRLALVDAATAAVLLDTAVLHGDGARAGARVEIEPDTCAIREISVRVAAGDPLDDVVLRSYVIGAAHMALGWVCTEGLTVDPNTGDVHDLTIRSFGIVRPKAMPTVAVEIVDEPGPPRPRVSDAAFAAVAAATWNALARAEGAHPEVLPARETRTARMLRR